MNIEIANTILNQLGGKLFMRITGSKNPVAIENGLQIELSENKLKATHLQIILDPSDTYSIKFLKRKGENTVVFNEHSDIYCNQLKEIFEEETGLLTSFY